MFLGGVLFYHRIAQADPIIDGVVAIFSLGGEFIKGSITKMAFEFSYFIFWLIGKMLAVMITVLDTFSRIPVYPKGGVPVVEEIWKIMRDMANVAFIVALVIAAFATIFNTFVSSMAFFKGMNWQQTLVKLLISAVLINFSLTLGVLVLDVAQVPTNMLLRSMGDIAGNLGNGLNPSIFLKSTGSNAQQLAQTVDAGGSAFVSLIFGVVLLGAFLVCILTGIMFIIYRIPMIWMLLMFSPVIWVARIFPQGEKRFSEWWSKLIGWAFFLPYYFFFVYLALYLLGNQDKIMRAITVNMDNTAYGMNNPGMSIQLIFFYAVVCIILMGGTKMAIGWAQSTGAAGKDFFAWADKTAKRMPGLNYLEASKVALKAKQEQIAKEGFRGRWTSKLYGGDLAQEKKEAKMKDVFGVGDKGASKGVLQKDVDLLKSRYKNESREKLEGIRNTGSANQRIAALEVLRSRGELSADGTKELYDQYAKQSPQAAKDFALRENYGKMNAVERKMFFDSIKDPEVKRKIALVMAEKGDIQSVDDIASHINIFGNAEDRREFFEKLSKTIESFSPKGREDLLSREFVDNDLVIKKQLASIMADKGDIKTVAKLEEIAKQLFLRNGATEFNDSDPGARQTAKEFIDKAKKKNLIVAIEAQANLKLVSREDGTPIIDFNELLEKEVKKMKPVDLLEIPVGNIEISSKEAASIEPGVMEIVKNKKALQDVLSGSLSKQKFEYIMTNATKEQLTTWEKLGTTIKAKIETDAATARDAEADTFAKALAKYMTPKP